MPVVTEDRGPDRRGPTSGRYYHRDRLGKVPYRNNHKPFSFVSVDTGRVVSL